MKKCESRPMACEADAYRAQEKEMNARYQSHTWRSFMGPVVDSLADVLTEIAR